MTSNSSSTGFLTGAAKVAAAAVVAFGLSATFKPGEARAGHDWVGPAIAGAIFGAAIAHHHKHYKRRHAYKHHHARKHRPYRNHYAYKHRHRPHHRHYGYSRGYYAPAIVIPLPGIYLGFH